MKKHPFGSQMFVIWSKINGSINNTQMKFNNKINEMTAALSSAQDTASRHLNSLRHIPAVDALMDIFNQVYEEVKCWSNNQKRFNFLNLNP